MPSSLLRWKTPINFTIFKDQRVGSCKPKWSDMWEIKNPWGGRGQMWLIYYRFKWAFICDPMTLRPNFCFCSFALIRIYSYEGWCIYHFGDSFGNKNCKILTKNAFFSGFRNIMKNWLGYNGECGCFSWNQFNLVVLE